MPLILLLVNFDLPGELNMQLIGRKMKEVSKVGHKKLRKNFRG